MVRMMFVFLLILGTMDAASCMDVFVNMSLSSASSPNYPTLAAAVSALVDSNGQLLDTNNTITIYYAATPTVQNFPAISITGKNNIGTLSIQYQTTITGVSTYSDCQSLALLNLTNSSLLSISNLDYFSISGMMIQLLGVNVGNSLANIGTVNFTNFCFNNTEPSLKRTSFLPNSAVTIFSIANSNLVSFTTGLYAYDSTKSLLITQTKQVVMQGLTIYILTRVHDLIFAAINVTNASPYSTIVSLTGMNITCQTTTLNGILPNIVYVTNVASLAVNNSIFSQCLLTYPATSSQSLISAINSDKFSMDNFTINNVAYGENPNQNTIFVAGTGAVTLSNFQVNTLDISTGVGYNNAIMIMTDKISNLRNQLVKVTIQNWNIQNSLLASSNSGFYFNFANNGYLQQLNMQNITVSSSSILFIGYFIRMRTFVFPSADSLSLGGVRVFNFNNISVNSCTFGGSSYFLYVYTTGSSITPAVETIQFNISNVNLQNNTISSTSIFQIEGYILTKISGLTAANNQLTQSSYLVNSLSEINTLIFSNSIVTNQSISSSSALLAYNATGSADPGIECAYLDYTTNTSIYAQTRPFMVFNCTFQNVTTSSGSTLIGSTNPMIIIQNNTFSQITLQDSYILELGNLNVFVSKSTYCVANQQSGSPSITTVIPELQGSTIIFKYFTAVETIMFAQTSQAGSIFYQARNASFDNDPGNSVYFITLIQNNLNGVSATSSDYILLLQNFQINNSTTVLVSNVFSNMTITALTAIIGSESINRQTLGFNVITAIDFSMYLLSLSSSNLSLLSLNSDVFNQTQGIQAYQITSSLCLDIQIQNISVLNVLTQQNFISLACTTILGQITLSDSTFQNITFGSIQYILQQVNFISFQAQLPAADDAISWITIENNVFSNITIDKQEGYIQGLFDNSFILILAPDCNLAFNDNKFESTSISPEGSIASLSVTTISISNCSFNNLTFVDVNGALNLVFETLLVNSSTFSQNSGIGFTGAGLMQLTNPYPDEAGLYVVVQNCDFTDNIAPYGTILSSKNTSIDLTMTNNTIKNSLVSIDGAAIYLTNLLESIVVIQNSHFQLEQNQTADYPTEAIVSVVSSSGAVSVELSNCNVSVSGDVPGVLVYLLQNQQITLNFSQLSFSPSSITSGTSFGLLNSDAVNATFTELIVINISISQTSIFTINCDTGPQTDPSELMWSLQIANSTFEDLELSQGIISVQSDELLLQALENLSIKISNTTFSSIKWQNTSNSGGGGLLQVSTSLVGKSTITADEYSFTVSNCTFSNLTSDSSILYNGVENLFDSVLLVENNNFHSIKVSGSGAIINPSLATATVTLPTDSTFLLSPRNPTYAIRSSNFTTIKAKGTGGIFTWQGQNRGINLNIANNSFKGVSSSLGGLVSADYTASSLFNSEGVAISASQTSPGNVTIITISHCTLINISAQSAGILAFQGNTQFYIVSLEKNTIENILTVEDGGIILAQGTALSASASETTRLLDNAQVGLLNMTTNQISNAGAENGGVIFESTPNQSLQITFGNNKLSTITALSRGGVFYIDQPRISITQNTFSNSQANIAGSIIYSSSGTLNLPNLLADNVLIQISDAGLAFAPTNLGIALTFVSNSSTITLPVSSNPLVTGLTSYSLNDILMNFTLVYSDGQEVKTVPDESNLTSISIVFIDPRGERSNSYKSNDCSESSCTFDPSGISLIGKAKQIVTVDVTYTSELYTQQQTFSIELRACISGEINNTDTEECVLCTTGTYSLQPSDEACLNCPIGIICNGGRNLTIEEGYYWSSVSSEVIVVVLCNDTDSRCQGGYENTCAVQYAGPACLQCNLQENYTPTENGTCDICLSKAVLIVLAVGLIILSIAYQIVLVLAAFRERRTMRRSENALYGSNDQQKTVSLHVGSLLIILITYFQISSILTTFDVGYVQGVIETLATFINAGKKVLLWIGCLNYFENSDPFSALKIQLIFYVLSPLAKILILVLIEIAINAYYRRKNVTLKDYSIIRIGIYAAIIIFLEQPAIIGGLCLYLSCVTLDPNLEGRYINAFRNIQCDTADYVYLRNVLIIPGLIFWGLVVPALFYYLLFVKRKVLFKPDKFRVILGFFYIAYVPARYDWGARLIVFKIGIFALNSLLQVSDMIRGIILICIFHLYLAVLKQSKPYRFKEFLKAEEYCIKTYLMILNIVLFKINVSVRWLLVIFDISILILYLLMIFYIVFKIFQLLTHKIIAYIDKMIEKKLESKVLKAIFKDLRDYHSEIPNRIDSYRRRGAISLDCDEKLRMPQSSDQDGNDKERAKIAELDKGVKNKLLIYLRKCLVYWSSNSVNEYSKIGSRGTMLSQTTIKSYELSEKIEGSTPSGMKPEFYSKLEMVSPTDFDKIPKDSDHNRHLQAEAETKVVRQDIQLTQNSRIDADSLPKTKDDFHDIQVEKSSSGCS